MTDITFKVKGVRDKGAVECDGVIRQSAEFVGFI